MIHLKLQKKFIIAVMFCCSLFCTGCGSSAQEKTETYFASELEIPNPDDEFDKETVYKERVFCTVGDTVYRLTMLECFNEENNAKRVACGIQILEAPYEKWKTYVYTNNWLQEKAYAASNICVSPRGEIMVMLWDGSDYYLTQWTDGVLSELQKVTEEFSKFGNPLYGSWEMDEQGNHYFRSGEEFISYDNTFKERKNVTNIQEQIFVANYMGLWRQGTKRELLCSFANNDVYIDTVKDLQILDDGRILIVAAEESVHKLLTVEWGIDSRRQNKEEIVIATDASPLLCRCVAEFNKQNSEYYVTLRPWIEEQESYRDYCTQIQMEISAGKGPDVVSDIIVDLSAYAQNGYLESWEKYLDLSDDVFFGAALEAGKVEGVTYGVPIAFTLETMFVDKALAEGKDSWTLRQFMEYAQAVQPETLIGMERAWDNLYYIAFLDEESKTFVDWEKGECYFDSEGFIELLEFSKQYQNTGSSLDYYGGYFLQSGKRLAVITSIGNVQFYLNEYIGYGDEISFIGYPVEAGSGNYISGTYYALNSKSKNKDGAAAFMQYLLSQEVQNVMTEEKFPVRREALSKSIANAKEEDEDISTFTLTDRYEDVLWNLLNNAKPKGRRYSAILNILYEETGAYFDGNRSAAEVAKFVQNRVQLYLDEQGHK